MLTKLSYVFDGVDQALKFFNTFPNNYKNERRLSHGRIADTVVKKAQGYAHKRTHTMEKGIKKGKVTENEMEVTASVKYSGYENKRGGDHAFFDKTLKEFDKLANAEFSRAVDNAINKSS